MVRLASHRVGLFDFIDGVLVLRLRSDTRQGAAILSNLRGGLRGRAPRGGNRNLKKKCSSVRIKLAMAIAAVPAVPAVDAIIDIASLIG